MAKKIIIGVIILVLIIGGAFYYIKGTPKYSLYQIKKSVQNHDSITFNKYVDVDRITSGLMDTAVQSFDEEMKKEDNPFGELGNGILQAMMPALKDELKSNINKSIEEISEGKDNKYVKTKVKEVIKEGKSAKITLENSDNEIIRLDMIQTPKRYWQVVGINFDDFKKISPDAIGTGDNSKQAEEAIKENIIEKGVGDEVELATMKIKINSVEEKQSIKGIFGTEKLASDGSKFVVINLTATNITKESFSFDSDGIRLTDNQDRKFDTWSDTIGNVDNYLEVRELQPSISETGMMVYKMPTDASEYKMDIGKKGTNEVYSIKLK